MPFLLKTQIRRVLPGARSAADARSSRRAGSLTLSQRSGGCGNA
jgi:hypothetical protein